MENADLIRFFYESFAKADAENMAECYGSEIIFSDPAFGTLTGAQVGNMWRMLVSPNVVPKFSNIQADKDKGSADWEAEYVFSLTGRTVINKIHADFKFKDGKIIRHTDNFSLWRWASQAFGLKGYLFGWTIFFKKKIQKQTNDKLKIFELSLRHGY